MTWRPPHPPERRPEPTIDELADVARRAYWLQRFGSQPVSGWDDMVDERMRECWRAVAENVRRTLKGDG